MRISLRVFAATSLVLLACTSPLSATQVVHQDTRALTLSSHDIVIGQVEQVQSRWNPSHTKIVTDVTVRVTRTLKGSPAERLTLTEPGGEVDGVRVTASGCAVFRPGEEALLFVWRSPKGVAQVNGLGQGKFEILRDAASGQATVRRALPGLGVRDARTLRAVRPGEPPPRIPLEDLVREIERTVAEEAGR